MASPSRYPLREHSTRRRAPRPSSRPEANARLTAGLAAMLLVLLAAEGVTVVRVGQLLTPHIVIGLILVPPVLAKIASTGWRFTRYYLGDRDFVAKGPPKPVLRVLGPVVVLTTLAVFASGIALILVPASWHGRLLLIHRASFIVWFAAMTVHVLGHLLETGRLAPLDWMRGASRRVRGAGRRRTVLVATLVAGVLLAAGMAGYTHSYEQGRHGPGLARPPAAAGK